MCAGWISLDKENALPTTTGGAVMANPLHELLGERPYHSIPHMPGSRVGPADRHINDGQYQRYMQIKDYRERIAVTEKLDGTCVGVVKTENGLVAIQRNGHPCSESPYEMHHRFAVYVKYRKVKFATILGEIGDRIMGEWVAQAHGIIYDQLPDLFFAFDAKLGGVWVDTMTLRDQCSAVGLFAVGLFVVPLIHYGMPLEPQYWEKLTRRSAFRSKGPAEGLVFRRELDSKRIDIAKWVRSDHVPGRYLPDVDGSESDVPIWLEMQG
jgi:hypothetical protein